MKMMGLSTFIYWLSWFVKNLIYLVIAMIFYTAFFKIPLGTHGKVLNYTDPTLFFFFLFCYALATIAFCFMISTFFNKGKRIMSVTRCGPYVAAECNQYDTNSCLKIMVAIIFVYWVELLVRELINIKAYSFTSIRPLSSVAQVVLSVILAKVCSKETRQFRTMQQWV